MMDLLPEKGVVLVKLPTSEWGNIPVPTKTHDSLTYGRIMAINKEDEGYNYLVGRIAYWRKYKDDARVGDNMAFIEINDILGTSNDSDS